MLSLLTARALVDQLPVLLATSPYSAPAANACDIFVVSDHQRRGASAVTHPIPSDDDAKWDLWSRAFEQLVFLKCMPHSCFSQGRHDASVASNLRDSIVCGARTGGVCDPGTPRRCRCEESSPCSNTDPRAFPVDICTSFPRKPGCPTCRDHPLIAQSQRHALPLNSAPEWPLHQKVNTHSELLPAIQCASGQAEAAERPQTLYVPLRFLNSDFPAQSGESAPFRARRAKDGVLHALSVRGCEVARRQAIPAQLAQPNRILTYRSRSPAAIRRESAGTARTTGAQVGVKPTTRGARLLRFPQGDLWCWSGSRWVWCFDCPRLSHRRREVDAILAGSLTRHGRTDLPARPLLLSACKVRAASLLGTASDLRILLLSSQAATSSYAGATRLLRGCYAGATRVLRKCYAVLRAPTRVLQASTAIYELLRAPTHCSELLRQSYKLLRAPTPLLRHSTSCYAALRLLRRSYEPLPYFSKVLLGPMAALRVPTSSYELLRRNPNPTTRLYALLRGCYASATTCYAVATRLLRECYAAATLLLWSAPEIGTFATMLRALRAPTSAPEWAQGLLMFEVLGGNSECNIKVIPHDLDHAQLGNFSNIHQSFLRKLLDFDDLHSQLKISRNRSISQPSDDPLMRPDVRSRNSGDAFLSWSDMPPLTSSSEVTNGYCWLAIVDTADFKKVYGF
ncbi:hypothetical protein B0H17DRAFT_1271277 [Mycena rosella]|uniref:Uncharacterized protein n=1 Tax=Mycena rosella TaxID=1033263 RepID=A0AAD7DN58_MYCRO|nr:hypothetical protein B0H17DRAFT_1271277 [Mycena rosella]